MKDINIWLVAHYGDKRVETNHNEIVSLRNAIQEAKRESDKIELVLIEGIEKNIRFTIWSKV